MILFYHLFAFIYSKSISLDESKYNKLIKGSKPFLLYLWDDKCQSCESAKSILNQLEQTKFNSITFSNLKCTGENSNICSLIKKEKKYPLIVWIHPEFNLKHVYTDDPTYKSLSTFIQKQVNFPFTPIKDKSQINDLKNSVKDHSIFIFYYKHENDPKISNLKGVIVNLNNPQLKFYSFPGQKTKFVAVRGKDCESTYTGDWSEDSVKLFIRRRIFPALIPLNDNTLFQLRESKRMALIAFFDPSIYFTDWSYLTQMIETDFQFAYVNYTTDNVFSRFVGIKGTALPQVILYDANNQKWINYDGDLTDTALTKWLNQLDINKADWKGPGNGVLAKIKIKFISNWISGGITFYLLLIVLIVVISFGVKLASTTFKKRPKHKRGSDRAFTEL